MPKVQFIAAEGDRGAHRGTRPGAAGRDYDLTKGTVTVKVVPRPGVLVAWMRPRWARTIHRAMERPNPVPPPSRDRAGSTR